MGASETWQSGPAWEDPELTLLAARLRAAHERISPLPRGPRLRLHRHLLAITDLAKRDQELAARRLAVFLDQLDRGLEPE
ncbi:hypothetical protein ABGB12_06135 [Actinocorallia sp. B10E7]|uniref:hypothetical protein n=1 Tax=Actinocorallia sp. B10E7 TaxID=3153558 RepID=UPI00325EBAA2